MRESRNQWLIRGLATPQSIEADLLLIQIERTTHKSMRPEGINFKDMPEQFDRSRFAGASQVNEASLRLSLPIKVKVLRERSSRRLLLLATCQALGISLREPSRKRAQGGKVLMMATRPDFLLPQSIKVFDHALKAHFQRRG